MKRRWIIPAVIAVLAAFATGFGWLLLADPRNSAVIVLTGRVTSGSRLGVRVGEPLPRAIGRISAFDGVKLDSVTHGGGCLGREHPSDRDVAMFLDDSWRHGIICLTGRQGRLEEVAWDYQLVPAFP